jgi:hypothetical protein
MPSTRLAAPLLVLGLLASPVAASAAVILTADCTINAGTCATGITGLDVGGTLYDVTFVLPGSYNSVYTTPPLFLGNQAGATAAAQAIFDLLSTSEVDGIVSNANLIDQFYVPYGLGNVVPGWVELVYGYRADSVWQSVIDCGPCVGSNDVLSSLWLPTDSRSWSVITPSAVPEPATLLLIGTGLAAAGVRRYRRRM